MAPRPQNGGMQNISVPTTEIIVDDVMRRWPSTIRIFVEFQMLCVGCPIANFHSVGEESDEHELETGTFLSKIVEKAKEAT
jgi:hybrid cluster-associated redox disulfide protein